MIDPGALAGSRTYGARVEALLAAMLQDDAVRVPGYRRDALARKAAQQGIEVAEATLEPVRELAAKNVG